MANLFCVWIEYLSKAMISKEIMSLKNSLPMFVLTFMLKGGLNQITFLFQFRLVFCDDFSNFSVAWYPLFLSTVSYVVLALLKSVLSQDKLDMRLLVIVGILMYI